MIAFKCKMCNGSLDVEEGRTVCQCPYCGTVQTLPRLDDDRKANLYDRANHFRRNNEYDKAMSVYEQILEEDKTDSETYWSLVLCRYGIEYVEDPKTHRHVPTINRMQYTSILADDDYKSALRYADRDQRELYEQEAYAIERIQKGILSISQQEEPFDVFICYKETDDKGKRTKDSVLAQDLYYGLKKEGFNVFFSRITLEDKLGTAYEPYIFAALNSAKVMVVLGTKPEHFNAVWVKNEWSRYLSLIAKGEKKVLIPAYKDMNPYDLPEDFSHLQAQDMSKLGFMQDIIHGIKKVVHKREKNDDTAPKVVINSSKDIKPILKRAYIFLEDGDFKNADEYAEIVLNMNPECSKAYIVKLLIELELRTFEQLNDYNKDISENPYYVKALRYADEEEREKILAVGRNCNDHYRSAQYAVAEKLIHEKAYTTAKDVLENIKDYKDSALKLRNVEKKLIHKKRRSIFKKIIIVIVILAMIGATIGLYFCDVHARNYLDMELSSTESGYIVIGSGKSVERNDGNVLIPTEYRGKPVIKIGARAFQGCYEMETIIIGTTVREIGYDAFTACANLKKVYYEGTKQQWLRIDTNESDSGNNSLIAAVHYYYSESAPTEQGNFWHYVDGQIVEW